MVGGTSLGANVSLEVAAIAPAFGLCQWFHFEDHRLDMAVRLMRDWGVTHVRTGLSWADSHRPGADAWFDRLPRLSYDQVVETV